MKVVVCIKQVADLSTGNFEIRDEQLIERGLSYVTNPYDEYAIEEALQIKETCGGSVSLVTVGPKRAAEALRMGMAMGADVAVHVLSECEDRDGRLTAIVLGRVLGDMNPDILLCGAQSSDWGNSVIGAAIAEYLKIPCVSLVKEIELSFERETPSCKNSVIAHQEMGEGFERLIEVQLPAVFTIQSGINTPRVPTLKDILRSTSKDIQSIPITEILSADESNQERTRVLGISPPPRTKEVQILKGELEEIARELATVVEERR